MNYSFIVVLCLISICEANEFLCQYFDKSGQSLEYYCKNYTETVPETCLPTNSILDQSDISASDVTELRIGGCDSDIVVNITETIGNVSALDISCSGYDSLDWLDLSPLLQKFDASHNEITQVSVNLFAKTLEITNIDLSFNNISDLDIDIFVNLKNLTYVNLSDNDIAELDLFANNNMLKTLIALNNPILFYDCQDFSAASSAIVHISWENVQELYTNCDGNRYSVVFDGENEGIYPASNGLYRIQISNDQAPSFQSIKKFVAGTNTFENVLEILPHFGALLTKLDLSGNYIGSFNTTTFVRFGNLEELLLSDTTLADFDFDLLKNQKQLKFIDISFNGLKFVNNTSVLATFDSLLSFNASDNRLRNAPEVIQHLGSSVQILDLSESFVGELNATTFQKLKSLLYLNLGNTNLSFTDSNPFDEIKTLKILDISSNNLSNVNFTTYSSTLNNLNEFYVSDASINASNVIQYLGQNLIKLDVSGNFVGHLNGTTFKSLEHLYALSLRNTNISLPDSNPFTRNKILAILDISSNNLDHANFTVISPTLSKLTEFAAADCHILNTAQVIRYLGDGLKKLDLSGNFVGELNATTFKKFTKLIEIDLSDTNLVIPNFNPFAELKSVKVLDISSNNLENVNFKFMSATLKELTEFYAGDCNIKKASVIIAYFGDSMEKLDLSSNYVGEVEPTVFKRFTNLKELNLSNTNLTVIPDYCFKPRSNSVDTIESNSVDQAASTPAAETTIGSAIDCTSNVIKYLRRSVYSIDLSGNSIGQFRGDTFKTLDYLVYLNLSNANISHFDTDSLQHQRELSVLDLSYNQLPEVDLALLSKNLNEIYLQGNNLMNVKNLDQMHFPQLDSMAIEQNQLSCEFLIQLTRWRDLKFIGNWQHQNTNENCELEEQREVENVVQTEIATFAEMLKTDVDLRAVMPAKISKINKDDQIPSRMANLSVELSRTNITGSSSWIAAILFIVMVFVIILLMHRVQLRKNIMKNFDIYFSKRRRDETAQLLTETETFV